MCHLGSPKKSANQSDTLDNSKEKQRLETTTSEQVNAYDQSH